MKKNMKTIKTIKIIGTIVLSALLFTGCADYEDYEDYEDCDTYADEEYEDYEDDAETDYAETDYEDDTEDDYRPQGSVGFLEGRTVIVTAFVGGADSDNWTAEEDEYVMYAQKVAADYLMNQAKDCGVDSEIIVWDEEHEDLAYDITYNGSLEDVSLESTSGEEGAGEFLPAIRNEIQQLPIDTIKKTYDADSIGFMVMVDTHGGSYANVYMPDYGMDDYYESVTMFMYDEYMDGDVYESVPAYAHEMLHLFGAVDLYQENKEDGVMQEICDYIEENDPNCLMYETYEPDGSVNNDGITQHLSDITKAMVGLTDEEEVLEMFPSLEREYPAAFLTK